jgi:gliding-associated putative ABC transporter substrate-binding component GldG
MLSRRLQYSTGSIVVVLIVLGILAVINFMSVRHFVRADLTEGKDFTISNSTKKVVGELDDIVNINAYFSKNLPPYLINLERQVKDILDEYKAFAHGNLEVKFIDPASDPALEQKIRFMGIPQARLNIIEKDKAEVVNVYFGMAVMYEDKKEVIPVVQNVMTLEYDLTSAIIKVKRSEEKTVGFLTGHKEYSTEEDYSEVMSSLGKQYNVVNVDVSEGKKVPENVNTLIVGGPKEKLSEREKYAIDQFLMHGGRIVFLIDVVDISPRGLTATEIDSNLNDMLEHYGVKLGRTLVLDRASNSNASFSSGFVQYSVPYPFWPRVTKERFAKDSPMVNQLESMILPWTGPVELVSSKVQTTSEEDPEGAGKLRGIELYRSSQYSWMKGKPFNLSPQQRFMPTGDMKSYPLGVAVSGKFKSFYDGKPVPEPEESDEGPSEAKSPEEPSTAEIIPESPETQIVVVGNARFISAGFLGRSGANLLFFENAVDWLTLGEDLINIRSRFVTDRPLKDISEGWKLFVRIINIGGASFLVIALGLTRFILKRRAKKLFETYSALASVE